MHPDGLAPRITNFPQWRAHLLDRLGRQAVRSGDPALAALHDELAAYPAGGRAPSIDADAAEIAVPPFPADTATAGLLRAAAAERPPT